MALEKLCFSITLIIGFLSATTLAVEEMQNSCPCSTLLHFQMIHVMLIPKMAPAIRRKNAQTKEAPMMAAVLVDMEFAAHFHSVVAQPFLRIIPIGNLVAQKLDPVE